MPPWRICPLEWSSSWSERWEKGVKSFCQQFDSYVPELFQVEIKCFVGHHGCIEILLRIKLYDGLAVPSIEDGRCLCSKLELCFALRALKDCPLSGDTIVPDRCLHIITPGMIHKGYPIPTKLQVSQYQACCSVQIKVTSLICNRAVIYKETLSS